MPQEPRATPLDLDPEAPEADAAEQRVAVALDEGEDEAADAGEPPLDGVDPADAAEQRAVVALDEDDYR